MQSNSIKDFSILTSLNAEGIDLTGVQFTDGQILTIDFDENHIDYKRTMSKGKNELIAKALGLGKGVHHVVDLSCGLAIDSVFLCQLGCQVTALERNKAVYSLLISALKRSIRPELKSLRILNQDAVVFLSQRSHPELENNTLFKESIDAFYFDPMFPQKKKKSALPRKEMVLFKKLVGEDPDAASVLAQALTWPVKRVVVKRPTEAPALLEENPKKFQFQSFHGKAVRFDVYFNLK